ncbi:MAG TPA: ABC transporter permease subunit [Jatrophihabitantaceae bacterium]|nr:ABC transporter permease subunit [Jatrophihabitantaceae bacterium]
MTAAATDVAGGRRSWLVPGVLAKIAFLVIMVGLVTYAVPKLIDQHAWVGLGAALAATVALVWIYTGRRNVPLKYLAPGTLLLVAFQLYPVLYTMSTAVTNYGDGHLLSKSQAISTIEAASVTEVPGTARYKLSVATKGNPASAAFVYFLTAPNGTVYEGSASGLAPVAAGEVVKSASGKVITARGWHILNALQVNARSADLAKFQIPSGSGFIKNIGVSEAYVGRTTVTYDAKADTLTDTRTQLTYAPKKGYFVATDGSGKRFDTGWKVNVGLANFRAVFDNSDIRGPIVRIFIWTLAFALLTVASTFGLGLLLAIALDHPRLRGQRLYRSLLLLPYALPAFISLLVWQSMYNRDFGLINHLLHTKIDWLGSTWSARVAILLANLWLGFPYMFLICTGVLQSIPAELRDAARIDGANAFQVFRSVTLPLLMISVMPLLIASFAFNFNNYNAIKLLTGGGPFPANNSTAGDTDILISYTFRIAFGAQGAQYGLAATISILIFVLIAGISYAGFRRTRRLEEIYG